MARIHSVLLTALLFAALSDGMQPACASSEVCANMKEAINAYQARDYRKTISALKGVSSKDELAHYYRALAYQQLSDFKEAESEYMWDYENAKNKDLVYKSWQGLQGLSKVRKPRYIAQATVVPGSKTLAEGGYYQPVADTNVYVKPPEWIVNYTPGCGRHHY